MSDNHSHLFQDNLQAAPAALDVLRASCSLVPYSWRAVTTA
ncbi:hypothetical protein PC116_g14951 [Phytophthora cactorum]|nr:hypothetical protein PC116_g14951 [Phytophthora cactorum]